MAANKLQRRTSKLHLLQTPANPKSAKRGSIFKNILRFYKLKLKLEQLQRECQILRVIRNEYITLLNHIQIPKEVKVEKIGEQFVVKVSCCNREGDKLVSILEAFDELGLDVVRASVSCGHLFSMEVIAVARGQQTTGIRDIKHAVVKAIDEKQGWEAGDACNRGVN
ncbi:Detected protein of unknown function [Hibiscus syriacus]|uniref:Plant bHLH transcription factor ACT-like domain-containing protein n=1 Tax=Hibiscus syriacus TaxID=106335 RepID=A0A6A3C4S0_HIBSY|nr:uncharacterized protein LOC120206017 [Hibiscus syriacus]KAE8722991.1 Detected protein of unknown function [Hibiscus syriacus]